MTKYFRLFKITKSDLLHSTYDPIGIFLSITELKRFIAGCNLDTTQHIIMSHDYKKLFSAAIFDNFVTSYRNDLNKKWGAVRV